MWNLLISCVIFGRLQNLRIENESPRLLRLGPFRDDFKGVLQAEGTGLVGCKDRPTEPVGAPALEGMVHDDIDPTDPCLCATDRAAVGDVVAGLLMFKDDDCGFSVRGLLDLSKSMDGTTRFGVVVLILNAESRRRGVHDDQSR